MYTHARSADIAMALSLVVAALPPRELNAQCSGRPVTEFGDFVAGVDDLTTIRANHATLNWWMLL